MEKRQKLFLKFQCSCNSRFVHENAFWEIGIDKIRVKDNGKDDDCGGRGDAASDNHNYNGYDA